MSKSAYSSLKWSLCELDASWQRGKRSRAKRWVKNQLARLSRRGESRDVDDGVSEETFEDIRRELAAMPPVECERDFDNEPEPFI
jgi:hypothetical protein